MRTLPPRRLDRFARFAATITLALALPFAAAFVRAAEPGTAAPASNAVPFQPYLRITRPDSNTIQLQVAARRFVSADRPTPVVWLTGVSHVGESNYFRALQLHLEAQQLVLYEGISDRRGPDKQTGRPPPPAADLAEDSSLQVTLAESLGLHFQLKAMDYSRPHFRNSDLTVSELQRLLARPAADGEPTGPPDPASVEFHKLLEIMDGSSVVGLLFNAGARLLGSSPKLQALAKLTLIETLGEVKGDLSRFSGLPPELQRVVKVLIEARNQAVIGDLRAELKRRAPVKSISVFYGAAHMEDMERRLQAEFNYRPAGEHWFTAFSVDLAKTGLTDAEVAMVRSLIQWQMQALQSGLK